MKEWENNEITEGQLKELDKILIELNKPVKGAYKCRGDDEAMIKSVAEAAEYHRTGKGPFLDNVVHIESLYK